MAAAATTNNVKQATATATATVSAMMTTSQDDANQLSIEIERLRNAVTLMADTNPEESLAKADMKKLIGERVYEREMALERRRMREVAQQEEELHPPKELEECPICLEHIPIGPITPMLCCGKHICTQCRDTNKLELCPLCRGEFPTTHQDIVNATQKYAENGASWAMHGMAAMYEFGQYGQVVYKQKALQWYRRAANQEYALSMYQLGRLYLLGEEGILPQSYPDAHRWLKAAADKGYAEAQASLGDMYWNGVGIEEDEEEGVRRFTLSLSQDPDFKQDSSIISSFFLGMSFVHGLGGVEKSLERAKFYLLKAAQANETSVLCQERLAASQYHLSHVLLDLHIKTYGSFFRQAGFNCIPRVLYWLRKSLENGHTGSATAINNILRISSNGCSACDRKKEELLPATKLKHCIRCKAVWYCCKECQVKDWKDGHKTDCIKM